MIECAYCGGLKFMRVRTNNRRPYHYENRPCVWCGDKEELCKPEKKQDTLFSEPEKK